MIPGRFRVSKGSVTGRWYVVGLGPGHYYVEDFPTLPEAHDHAMKRARTVEVELPKVEKNKCINADMSPAMFVEKTPATYGIYLGHRYIVGIDAKELKPLGEYLLALYYHHGRNRK